MKPLPETIILYHTSPIGNKDSIIKHGLTLAKFDFEKKLIEIENAKISEQMKEDAKVRLLECFRYKEHLSGYICLSGNKAYSIQNGCASNEYLWYLGKKDYKEDMVCFTIELPIRILEILTCKFWQNILEKFEKLWKEGYFTIRAWEAKVLNLKYNNFKNAGLKLETNPIEGYDVFFLNHVPPEFIKSYEVIQKKG